MAPDWIPWSAGLNSPELIQNAFIDGFLFGLLSGAFLTLILIIITWPRKREDAHTKWMKRLQDRDDFFVGRKK